tara:strand:- start:1545 stop:2117 length:573 start_codon:yes stop_codon:yes gene_type:complete
MTFRYFGYKDYSDIFHLAKSTPDVFWKKRCSAEDEWLKPSRTDYEQGLHKHYNPLNSTYFTLNIENDYFNSLKDRGAFKVVEIDDENCNAIVIKSSPGNIEAPHYDLYGSYLGRDKTLEELKPDLDRVRRVWIPLQPWALGQMLFCPEETLTKWHEFTMYEIPNNTLHGFVNASDKIRYTLVLTGLRTCH